MIAATVIAALAWPSFLKPPPAPAFLKRPPAFIKKLPKLPSTALKPPPIPEQLIPHKRDFALPDPYGEPLAVTEVRIDGELVLVPVKVEGKGPYWFALDSGSPHSIVDPALIARTELRPRGAPNPAVNRAWMANLTVGGVDVFTPSPRVTNFDGTMLSGRVRGVLGAEIFRAFVVRIDLERGRLALYDPITFRPGNEAPTPVALRDGGLYAPITVEPRYGAAVQTEVRLDTGSDDFAGLDPKLQGEAAAPALVRDDLAWKWTTASKVRTVQAGPHAIYNAWVLADADQHLGMEFFRRFDTIIDATHGKMWLYPTARTWQPTPAPKTAP